MNIQEATFGLDTPEEMRLSCAFSGRVQGVGFRWTMQRLALEAGVTGWAANEPDGTVTCELQGPGTALVKVLRGVDREFEQRNSRSRGWFARSLMGYGFEVDRCEKIALSDGDRGQFSVR